MKEVEETKEMNLHQRMAKAMESVTYLQKEKKHGMQYSIVSHDAVTAYVRPALLEVGVIYYPISLSRSQDGNRTQVDLSVRFVNVDNPADHIDVPSCGYGIDSQDKGPGKAISYAVKYALLKALGLETGDDPDKEQNVEHEPAEKIWDKANDRKRYLNSLLDLAVSEDAPGLRQLWNELNNEQRLDLWAAFKEFPTQRSTIKKLLEETKDEERS